MTSVFSFLGEKRGNESGGVTCVCVCMIVLVIGHKQRTVVFISIMPMVVHIFLGLQVEDGRTTRDFLQE